MHLLQMICRWKQSLMSIVGRFPRTLHAAITAAGADILYLYMRARPKQQWLHKVLQRCEQCCENRPSKVMSIHGGVYYLVSAACRATYIGETQHFLQRWMSHTTSVRGHSIQRVHKHMRGAQYGHTYFMLPITIVRPVATDIKEQRKERRDVFSFQRLLSQLRQRQLATIDVHGLSGSINCGMPCLHGHQHEAGSVRCARSGKHRLLG